MKLVTWNVNGFRAIMKKGFEDFFKTVDADIFCIQETKLQMDQVEISFDGYHAYWHCAERKGYSGTAVFTKTEPVGVSYDLDDPAHTGEGRVITLEFDEFYLVNVYTPNSKEELARLTYRMEWETAFRDYVVKLDRSKPVILCGDMNVAHQDMDLKNPKTNHFSAGFSDGERQKLTELLESGFTDCFRYLYPDRTEAYTWWSYLFHAREKNAGWRIDYFLLSDRIRDWMEDCVLCPEIMGSDHCPVQLTLKNQAF